MWSIPDKVSGFSWCLDFHGHGHRDDEDEMIMSFFLLNGAVVIAEV